ncbi:serine/threonine protein kinase [Stanieria cyanosphaera PCC 7437]|uniref:Serine/threonine protein kinase n=1 Tax=Stanieria cyanosphaera (strain ATCC 29371 / PCC 7437) TaxID=111780 RepID=K9XU15_STAC7|nr:serine/threonine-protein kinase [Stanieria cyanosphaera]AFZ36080.1 serine/threonine protein kinase [Stanieria cyanosphaera PCC 7437]
MKEEILCNRYLIQKQLGKRGGRETLLAKDIQTEELVVVKLLQFGLDFQWEQLKLFEREAQTLQNINHPAIPKYLDYFEINSPEYQGFALVQTYIQAQSLAEQLDKGRTFTEAEIKQLAEQILKILIYLHSQNPPIIHRDLKPSNILLTNRSGNHIGDVYLIDFGSVQNVAAKQEGTITIVGTYGYMPPEQFGDRCILASDLYSLGATLINLVTRIEPADLPQQEGRIQFERVVNLSIQLKDWLKRMIEPSLDKRFSSAQVALDNLINLSQSESNDLNVVELSDRQKFYLQKSVNRLEIIIEPKTTKLSLLDFIIIVIGFLVFVVLEPGALAVLIIFVGIICISSVYYIQDNILPLFVKKKLIIEKQKIALTYQVFKFKYDIIPPTSNSFIYKLDKLETDRFENIVLNKIIIWAGRNKNELKKYEIKGLNEAELNWLSRELSDWLQLPIHHNDE